MTIHNDGTLEVFTKSEREIAYKTAKDFLEKGFYLIALNSTTNDTRSCTCGKKSCSSPGKHPRFKSNWKVSATNDHEKIVDWFLPSSKPINIAVATGRKSPISGKYLVVVDVDQANHEILDRLPNTFRYRTGSGGHHFWYWSDNPIPNSASSIAEKVDIRGTNGYVVVPPSRHISGGTYRFENDINFDTPISYMPSFISDSIKKSTSNTIVKSTTKKTKVTPSGGLWPSMLKVTDIRNNMQQGMKIPKGARNSTIHRLLSSDRARGADESRLKTQAICYKAQCENYTEISQAELDTIVGSVMKYPAYDTSYDKVNERFFDYKQAAGKELPETIKQKIVDLDNKFFENLPTQKRSLCNMELNSLETIARARESFFQKNQVHGPISRYRPQLLAKKLESLGFTRHRTSRGNLWDVDLNTLQSEETVLGCLDPTTESSCYNPYPYQEITQNMTVKVTDATNTFKITRKNHPNERMYKGRATMETQGAITQALECLDEQQFGELALGTLIYDEESTAELFDSILPGDIIGLCGLEPLVGWVSHQWEVLETDSDLDMLKCKQRYSPHKEKLITFEDVSIGLLLGRAEILLRDGKPYGLTDEEMNMTVQILDLSKKESDASDEAAVPSEPDVASTPLTASAEEVPKVLRDIFEMSEDGVYVQDSAQGDSTTTTEQ